MKFFTEYFNNIDIHNWQVIFFLIIIGFIVGFINTMAGSGSIISYSVFMMFGLPATVANGTLRLGVLMQTFSASLNFNKGNILEINKGITLAMPVVVGSLTGSYIAVSINENVFEKVIAIMMLLVLFSVIFDSKKWIQGKIKSSNKINNKLLTILIFFVIGLYGRFIHIGVGILFI